MNEASCLTWQELNLRREEQVSFILEILWGAAEIEKESESQMKPNHSQLFTGDQVDFLQDQKAPALKRSFLM